MQHAGTAKTVQEILQEFPRVELASLPTPIEELKRFSAALGGPRIFIKRDDLTGLAGGVNKTRKLEFLVGDALSKNADCLITAGAVQSNHCLQTAAAAAKVGLECHLVFGAPTSSAPSTGNYYLDQLLGAKFHWTEKRLRNQKMQEVADELRAQGRSPYVIPVGGSNYIGALGYVNAMFEIKEEIEAMKLRVDHLYFGTSSGGTQIGLALGSRLCGFDGSVTGVSIDHVPDDKSEFKYKSFLVDTIAVTAGALGVEEKIEASDLIIDYDYLGAGYGVVGDVEREAVRLLATTEGILIGPVYTGRALAGVIGHIRQGRIRKDETVLFLHTGDDIALHAYVDELLS